VLEDILYLAHNGYPDTRLLRSINSGVIEERLKETQFIRVSTDTDFPPASYDVNEITVL
jgi:hypothetical protein